MRAKDGPRCNTGLYLGQCCGSPAMGSEKHTHTHTHTHTNTHTHTHIHTTSITINVRSTDTNKIKTEKVFGYS